MNLLLSSISLTVMVVLTNEVNFNTSILISNNATVRGNVTNEDCVVTGESYLTPLPNNDLKCQDIHCLDMIFSRIQSSCVDIDISFLCSFVYPLYQGNRILRPCQQYCKDVFSRCIERIFYEFICDSLPHGPCQATLGERKEETRDFQCVTVKDQCAAEGLNSVHESELQNIPRSINYFYNPELRHVIKSCWHALSAFYVCGQTYPKCVEGVHRRIYPCAEYCYVLAEACTEGDLYTKSKCEARFQKQGGNICLDPISSSLKSIKTPVRSVQEQIIRIRKPRRSNRKCHCQTFAHKTCSNILEYTTTFFPNYFTAVQNSMELNELLQTYSNCPTPVLKFFCKVFFPPCKEDHFVEMPCLSECKALNRNSSRCEQIDCEKYASEITKECRRSSLRQSCTAGHFECKSTNMYTHRSLVCDGANDCEDLSDEKLCTCDEQTRHLFGVTECGCEKDQIKCRNIDKCYMAQWICDGDKDCPDGEDEANCTKCSADDQWRCVNGDCIELSKRCDNNLDCKDRSDEIDCLRITKPDNILLMHFEEYGHLSLCLEGFTDAMADEACGLLGFDMSGHENWTGIKTKGNERSFQLHDSGEVLSMFGLGDIISNCPQRVSIQCPPKPCGGPKLDIPPANMEASFQITWPWMAYIEYENKFICGASIFNEYFVLTAAHCVHKVEDLTRMQIVTGTNHIITVSYKWKPQPNEMFYRVKRVIIHPSFNPRVEKSEDDIALVLVEKRILFNEDTQPVCQPEEGSVFSKANDCFMAGWGRSSCNPIRNRLRQRKLTLWDVERCNGSLLLNGVLREKERCAEFYNGIVEIGRGDGGSPIFCNDVSGVFKLVGIMSPVPADCFQTSLFTFTAFENYISWVEHNTRATFTCDNKRVLFHEEWRCDNNNDCGDNSDEVRGCDVKLNCSFDDKFLCGYQVHGSGWKHLTSGGGLSDSVYPWFDHTLGNYPGYWLSLSRDSYMTSPNVTLRGRHCVHFYYHTRKPVDLGAVIFHFDGNTMEKKYDVSQTTTVDLWIPGMFEVGSGPFQMLIRSYQDVFSIDDIQLVKGSCASHGCLDTEFKCLCNGTVMCLPLAARCNIATSCDSSTDELNCSSSQYSCDFENGKVCALMQSEDDDSEWTLSNSSQTKLNINNHTYQGISGSFLRLDTSHLNRSHAVIIGQLLALNKKRHCLRLFYASNAASLLTIYYYLDNIKSVLRTIPIKKFSWRGLQVNLPENIESDFLYYKVSDIEDNRNGEILLDNITITPGTCQCPNNTIRCKKEFTCIHPSQICDGVVDCFTSQFDEKNCQCRADKYFKCHKKLCIPKEKACNRIIDCPNGKDEGVICDRKKNVRCDFEDPYLCGYSLISKDPDQIWTRTNQSINQIMGLTLGESIPGQGYYMAAYHENHLFTSLTSVSFKSRRNGLIFSYFVYDPETRNKDPYPLTLMYRALKTNMTKAIFFAKSAKYWMWESRCVDLPDGDIQVIFLALKNYGRKTVIGLDDVTLIKGGCL